VPPHLVAELLNGELHTTPRPALRHARVATVLGSQIVGPFDRGRGWEQQRSGCVCVASPPSFNPRLASQQGVFLVSCAKSLTFRQSLNRMMKSQTGWCKTVDIEAGRHARHRRTSLPDECSRAIAVSRHGGTSRTDPAKGSPALEVRSAPDGVPWRDFSSHGLTRTVSPCSFVKVTICREV
jgi:hypothetical protein